MIEMIHKLLIFFMLFSVSKCFDDSHIRWMYEKRPNEVFTGRKSEIIKDPNSKMCYRKFFVHMGDRKYEEHFLPSECDRRFFTPSEPWARSMGLLPSHTGRQALIYHHKIARELPNQETQFIKQLIKSYVDLNNKIKARVEQDPRILPRYKLN